MAADLSRTYEKRTTMLRIALCSLAFLALPLAAAADTKKDQDKDAKTLHATITKIDSKNNTVAVKTADNNGKDQEKTLSLSSDVKYLNAAGKDAKADSFKAGDDVCIVQKNDKVTEIRKEAEAKIVNVDRNTGRITVRMNDENGKDVERTFRLVEESEYVDSTGRVALLDVFKSGDDILFVEADGRIKSMKKAGNKQTQTGAKEGSDKKSSNK
jgi:uncharacterized protein YigE (DUF2233 family)